MSGHFFHVELKPDAEGLPTYQEENGSVRCCCLIICMLDFKPVCRKTRVSWMYCFHLYILRLPTFHMVPVAVHLAAVCWAYEAAINRALPKACVFWLSNIYSNQEQFFWFRSYHIVFHLRAFRWKG